MWRSGCRSCILFRPVPFPMPYKWFCPMQTLRDGISATPNPTISDSSIAEAAFNKHRAVSTPWSGDDGLWCRTAGIITAPAARTTKQAATAMYLLRPAKEVSLPVSLSVLCWYDQRDTAAHIIGYFYSFDKFFVFTQNHMPPSKYPLISAFPATPNPTERLLLFYWAFFPICAVEYPS